jgi:hypothetical protein
MQIHMPGNSMLSRQQQKKLNEIGNNIGAGPLFSMEDHDQAYNLKKQPSQVTVGQVLSSGSNPCGLGGEILLIEDGNGKS